MYNSRYDERDTIFSRIFEIEPGSERYKEYYSRHPELEELDNELRSPADGVFTDRIWENAFIDGGFAFIKELRAFSGAESGDSISIESDNKKSKIPARELTGHLQHTAQLFGAAASGAVNTPIEYAYSIRGRGRHYGKENFPVLPYTFVFAIPMDTQSVMAAPAIPETVDVVRAYTVTAATGMAISYGLRQIGYRAVCHMDGESQLVLPPLAETAGLGKIGWMGILLTNTYGPRVRLGAVSTDAPLAPTERSDGDVFNFCRTCGKCVDICPSNAITPLTDRHNAAKPAINQVRCFSTWKKLGTDCGACLAACPYGKRTSIKEKGKLGVPLPGDPDFLKSFMYGQRK